MAIDMVKVRATISIGSTSVSTPYIQSFNVTKSRGQPSTFSAAVKIRAGAVSGSITGGGVVIKAGTASGKDTIFTGFVERASTQPCWDDPNYVILNLAGSDALKFLQGKKYTRRCRGTKSSWVEIKSVDRPGLKSGKFNYREASVLHVTSATIPESGGDMVTRVPTAADGIDVAKAPDGNTPTPVNLTIINDPAE